MFEINQHNYTTNSAFICTFNVFRSNHFICIFQNFLDPGKIHGWSSSLDRIMNAKITYPLKPLKYKIAQTLLDIIIIFQRNFKNPMKTFIFICILGDIRKSNKSAT